MCNFNWINSSTCWQFGMTSITSTPYTSFSGSISYTCANKHVSCFSYLHLNLIGSIIYLLNSNPFIPLKPDFFITNKDPANACAFKSYYKRPTLADVMYRYSILEPKEGRRIIKITECH